MRVNNKDEKKLGWDETPRVSFYYSFQIRSFSFELKAKIYLLNENTLKTAAKPVTPIDSIIASFLPF